MMSSGWSAFVIVLTVANILGCLWLLWWTTRPPRANEQQLGGGAQTGHVWDHDLREYNNPLPRWWLWLFYMSVAFGLIYLVLFPGLGNFAGTKGWSQSSQYAAERQRVEERAAMLLAPFAQLSVPALADNPQAMSTAHNLFQNNCAQCHGSDGGGARGFPNLADADWQWGGDADSVVQTITNGRVAAMPPWGEALGAEGIEQVVAYVQSLSGQPHDAAAAALGRPQFGTFCTACHGADGRGNPLLGAPNLTDAAWLYGSDAASIREAIVKGRNNQMPAFGERLGEQRVRLLAAYVQRMSRGQPVDGDAS
jgi:cytochrome c oxidase cbb3-type subunit 3